MCRMCRADKNRCKASYTGKYAAVNGTIHATRAAAPAHSAAGPCSVRISMKQSPNDRANVESAACMTSCVLTTSDGLVSVAAKAPVAMATTISLMVDDDDDEAVAVDIGVSLLLLASSEIALVAAVLLVVVVVVDDVVVATRLKSSYSVNSSMV